MTSDDLKLRTKQFALRIIKLIENLPINIAGKVISNQLLRSSTSVEANYRAACRSRTKAEFISKIRIVEEEADESLYWLELINDSKLIDTKRIENLINESSQLTAIFTSIGKTTKYNLLNSKPEIRNPKLKNA